MGPIKDLNNGCWSEFFCLVCWALGDAQESGLCHFHHHDRTLRSLANTEAGCSCYCTCCLDALMKMACFEGALCPESHVSLKGYGTEVEGDDSKRKFKRFYRVRKGSKS